MRTLCCTVPVPPSVNHLYTTIGRGRALTIEGRVYKQTVGWIIRAAAMEQGWKGGTRYALTLRLYFKSGRRRDISNCVKIVEDCLSETLAFDDCCVDRLLVERAGIDADDPRCEIMLETTDNHMFS